MQTKRLSLLQRAAFGLVIASFGGLAPVTAADEAFVVVKGATIEGQIDGSLQLLNDGEVQIAAGASLSGDLMVPAARPVRKDATDPLLPSTATKVDNRGGAAALRGGILASETYQVPAVLRPGRTPPSRSVVVEINTDEDTDFREVGNLTLNKHHGLVNLPPGAYGNFSVKQGTLLLGFGGGRVPLRYTFNRLDVEAAGRVLTAGPVVVTVAEGGTWSGQLGDTETPFWLDVRVASGDVTLRSGSQVAGFLSAPTSVLTIQPQALLSGGAIVEKLVVEKGARAAASSPDWTAQLGNEKIPAFAHRALRLQRELAMIKRVLPGGYSAAGTYVEDVPYVMVSVRSQTEDSGQAAAYERQAIFESFCTLFGNTGFERAGIVLTAPVSAPTKTSAGALNIILSGSQFRQILQEIGTRASVADNIQTVRASSELLDQFVGRVLELGAEVNNRR